MEEQPQAAAVDSAPKASQSNCPSGDTEACFTYFPKLPPEIRAMIWDLMISPHLLNMMEVNNSAVLVSLAPRYPLPVLLQVCHESRELVRRTGSLAVFGSPPDKYVPVTHAWLDSHRDTVRIYRFTTMEYVPHTVENVLYDWASLVPGRNEELNMNLLMLSKLKRFQFNVDSRHIPRKIWNVLAGDRQHSEMPDSILVDIDDEYEVQLVTDTLLSRPEWHDLSGIWLQMIRFLQQENFRGDGGQEKNWEAARKQLQERWIKSHCQNVTSAADDSDDEIHHAKMPDFRRVLSLLPKAEEQCPTEVEQDAGCRNKLFNATLSPCDRSRFLERVNLFGLFILECIRAIQYKLDSMR
ncbi:hypothetical protein F4678DRAFT_421044 [Xylaria arbuscula]|nr:hypothetical protein F4678DRAFT_421044 [Xylaria arbuscula]